MKEFVIFWVFGLIGAAAVIPYQFSMLKEQIEGERVKNPTKKIPPLPVIKLISYVQTALLLGISAFFGVKLAPKVDLHWPILTNLMNGTPIPYTVSTTLLLGIALAFITTVIMLGFELFFIKKMNMKTVKAPSRSQAIAASLYGGISEEIISRLFFMSLVVYLSSLLGLESSAYWVGIMVAALFFGLLHLPAAINLLGKSPIVVVRTLLLNMIPGIVFGVLFWKYGIEIAMFTHFCADIFLHVIIGPELHKRINVYQRKALPTLCGAFFRLTFVYSILLCIGTLKWMDGK